MFSYYIRCSNYNSDIKVVNEPFFRKYKLPYKFGPLQVGALWFLIFVFRVKFVIFKIYVFSVACATDGGNEVWNG